MFIILDWSFASIRHDSFYNSSCFIIFITCDSSLCILKWKQISCPVIGIFCYCSIRLLYGYKSINVVISIISCASWYICPWCYSSSYIKADRYWCFVRVDYLYSLAFCIVFITSYITLRICYRCEKRSWVVCKICCISVIIRYFGIPVQAVILITDLRSCSIYNRCQIVVFVIIIKSLIPSCVHNLFEISDLIVSIFSYISCSAYCLNKITLSIISEAFTCSVRICNLFNISVNVVLIWRFMSFRINNSWCISKDISFNCTYISIRIFRTYKFSSLIVVIFYCPFFLAFLCYDCISFCELMILTVIRIFDSVSDSICWSYNPSMRVVFWWYYLSDLISYARYISVIIHLVLYNTSIYICCLCDISFIIIADMHDCIINCNKFYRSVLCIILYGNVVSLCIFYWSQISLVIIFWYSFISSCICISQYISVFIICCLNCISVCISFCYYISVVIIYVNRIVSESVSDNLFTTFNVMIEFYSVTICIYRCYKASIVIIFISCNIFACRICDSGQIMLIIICKFDTSVWWIYHLAKIAIFIINVFNLFTGWICRWRDSSCFIPDKCDSWTVFAVISIFIYTYSVTVFIFYSEHAIFFIYVVAHSIFWDELISQWWINFIINKCKTSTFVNSCCICEYLQLILRICYASITKAHFRNRSKPAYSIIYDKWKFITASITVSYHHIMTYCFIHPVCHVESCTIYRHVVSICDRMAFYKFHPWYV